MGELFIEDPYYGIGRKGDDGSTVLFFDSPAVQEFAAPLDPDAAREVRLEPNQRVWFRDGGRWRIGRIDGASETGAQYIVALPNNEARQVDARDLRVRWNRPLSDPLSMLIAKSTETRFFYAHRSAFLDCFTRQEAACEGLGGLLSSGVEMHQHQLGAARRVLQDPVRRYLLADEVGLGKTIEAGMVVRQLLIEEPGDVALVVPSSLRLQWKSEIEQKFHLDSLGARVHVVAHEEVEGLRSTTWRALVVDEAHRLTGWEPGDLVAETRYARLRDHSTRADAVLLLSATPVRSNEDAFLRLLHLLDPETYDLNDLTGFRRRVAMRDELAETMLSLDESLPIEYLEAPLRHLQELLPDDSVLSGIVPEFLGGSKVHGNESALRIRRLRTHLSETYRIHRRMIRNRRSPQLIATFPVRGRVRERSSWLIEDADERRPDLVAALDDIRAMLATVHDRDAAIEALRICYGYLAGPLETLEDLVSSLQSGANADDSGEVQTLRRTGVVDGFLNVVIGVLRRSTSTTRLDAVSEWSKKLTNRERVVVACKGSRSAKALVEQLQETLGGHRVAQVLDGDRESERLDAVIRFNDSPYGCVLVIDRSAEEGLNLQCATAVLHYDLPMSANQLDQRLGRFDRWTSGDLQPVRSLCFRDLDPEVDGILGGWRRLLDEAFGIFEESTATFQYVLPALEREFFERLLDDGPRLVLDGIDGLRERLSLDRRRIIGQDLLDSLDDDEEDREFRESVRDAESDSSQVNRALRGYAGGALGLNFRLDGSDSANERQSLVIPRSTASRIVGTSRESSMQGQSLLADRLGRVDYATKRRTAVERGYRLARWGDPLVDRLLEFALQDDRGRAFICETPLGGKPSDPSYMFVFDFRIEAQQSEFGHLGAAQARSARSTARKYLPPRFAHRTQIAGISKLPPEAGPRFMAMEHTNLGSRHERLEELTAHFDWALLCREQYNLAEAAVRASLTHGEGVEASVRRFDRDVSDREAIIGVRRRAGLEHQTLDSEVIAAVRRSLESPQVSLDSCGVVILTTGPNP